jgi:molybdopterin synthase sulfur carrier subunit
VATVFLPMPIRRRIGGEPSLVVEGATLRQVINNLEERIPGIREELIDPELDDRVIRTISAIIDGEAADMGLRTTVGENSEVHFLPAIAGGAPRSLATQLSSTGHYRNEER